MAIKCRIYSKRHKYAHNGYVGNPVSPTEESTKSSSTYRERGTVDERFFHRPYTLRVEPLRAQAKKTTKITKNAIRIKNIFAMSQRFEVTLWKYLRISP